MAEKIAVRPLITALQTGDTIAFSLDRLKTVKSTASEVGTQYQRKFTTHIINEERLITVTRTK